MFYKQKQTIYNIIKSNKHLKKSPLAETPFNEVRQAQLYFSQKETIPGSKNRFRFYFQFYLEMQTAQQVPITHVGHDEHYLIMHDKMLKCVCELCTCGKHQCPRPRIKGNFATSYTDHYKDVKITSNSQPKQEYKYEQRHYNPESLKTNYQDTYVPKEVVYNSPSKLQSYGNKLLHKVPFVGKSSYNDQYKPYAIKAQQNPEEDAMLKGPRPGQINRPTVKFDGVTSYKSHFVEPPRVESKPIQQMTYQRAPVPFYGGSSYKNDFPEHKIQPRVQIEEPSPNYRAPQAKFQGSTSYTDQYKGYQMKIPESDLSKSRNMCVVQKIHVPPINYVNEKNHIYYDPDSKKFV